MEVTEEAKEELLMKAVKRMREVGPNGMKDVAGEFFGHVSTLMDRIKDLYQAEPLLALLGIHYKFEAFMDAASDESLIEIEYGSAFSDKMMNEYAEFKEKAGV